MNIENKIRKRIKTIAILKNEYPKEIEISQEEYNELKKYVIKNSTVNIGRLNTFEGVKIICKN